MSDFFNLILPLGGFLLSLIGWLILPIILFLLVKDLWIKNARQKTISNMSWVLLEIRPPKDVKKTPKSMEQIFAGLHGFQSSPNWWERNIKGKIQDWFSFEMVSDSGQIHFYIRTVTTYRNFVESQIYAQYPQAEIIQVDDYVQSLPKEVPNKDFDIWGTELVFTADYVYPIRTYAEFERNILLEEQRLDPLSSLAEIFSNAKEGERLWIQTLIRPIDHKWIKAVEKEKNKLTDRKEKPKKKGGLSKEIAEWNKEISSNIMTTGSDGKKEEKKPDEKPKMLTKIEVEILGGIEEKMSKVAYETIIRFMYLAPTNIFAKANAGAVIGSFKQFSNQRSNGFKPNKKITPKIDYSFQFKKSREFARKKKLIAAYQNRDFETHSEIIDYMRPLWFERLPILNKIFVRSQPCVLNIEELATVYHFPAIMVETPAMPKVEAKKAEPPMGLPV